MKRPMLDRVGFILNIVLSIFYIPFSMYSWLLFMASEATIGATNKLYISIINTFCIITLTIPFISIISIAFSIKLRKKEKSLMSFNVQFLPLIIFAINMALLYYAESIK